MFLLEIMFDNLNNHINYLQKIQHNTKNISEYFIYDKSWGIVTLFLRLNCGRELSRYGGAKCPSKNRNATKTFYNPLRKYPGDLCKRFSQYRLCSFLQNL